MKKLFQTALIVVISSVFMTSYCYGQTSQKKSSPKTTLFKADNPNFQYVGRIDFANVLTPRMWAPGAYINARFEGQSCEVLVNDELMGGSNHNYISIAVDDQPAKRIRLSEKNNRISVGENLSNGIHTLTICKSTESGIGYIEFEGLYCKKLVKPQPLPERKIEFIGNSITCGTGADRTEIDCGKGVWHDQHNAYMSYGPLTARALNAQWTLTAVSGIGLMHSCCNLDIVMPDVFDKVNLRSNAVTWDFKRYQPDVVTMCLGQNDGIQDSTEFCSRYVKFISQVKTQYPKATIVLLTSPMADPQLRRVMENYLTGIVNYEQNNGVKDIHPFFFSKGFNSGCDSHPDLAEHKIIADELTIYLKKTMNW
jgi:hypothetical protein